LFLDDEMVGVRESIRAEDDTTDAELDIESQEIVTSRDSHAVVIAAVHKGGGAFDVAVELWDETSDGRGTRLKYVSRDITGDTV
jgi:hypothetical protein